LRQWRQHIRVTILPPNIFSTDVELGLEGSSGGEGKLDCFSFWQILVPVFSSSCSLQRAGSTGSAFTHARPLPVHPPYTPGYRLPCTQAAHAAQRPIWESCPRASNEDSYTQTSTTQHAHTDPLPRTPLQLSISRHPHAQPSPHLWCTPAPAFQNVTQLGHRALSLCSFTYPAGTSNTLNSPAGCRG
jgi:hypothetical protein